MSELKKSYENRVAQIKKGTSKVGNEYYYLQFNRDIEFKAGDKLYLNDFVEKINKSVEKGSLSREKGDELLAKMPFLLYDVTLPGKTNA